MSTKIENYGWDSTCTHSCSFLIIWPVPGMERKRGLAGGGRSGGLVVVLPLRAIYKLVIEAGGKRILLNIQNSDTHTHTSIHASRMGNACQHAQASEKGMPTPNIITE